MNQKEERFDWQLIDDERVWVKLDSRSKQAPSTYRAVSSRQQFRMNMMLLYICLGFLLGIGTGRYIVLAKQTETIIEPASQPQSNTVVEAPTPATPENMLVQRPTVPLEQSTSELRINQDDYELSEAPCLVISLYYRDGYSAHGIATQLGLPIGQVNQYLHKK